MVGVNAAFLRFRLRRCWTFLKDIPIVYLIFILISLSAVLALLYNALKGTEGWTGLALGAGLLFIVGLYHLHRKDYRFVLLVETYPWRVFAVDYLLVATPFLLFVAPIYTIYWFLMITVLVAASCVGISFLKQPFARARKRFPVPRFIPAEAYELRSAFRRYGGWILLPYLLALACLYYPYPSFFFLWFFVMLQAEAFRHCEPTAVLCSHELSPRRFLLRKLRVNLGCFVAAIAPVCLLYAVIHPLYAWLMLAFFIVASLNIVMFVLMKYAYYQPNEPVEAGQITLSLSLMGILIPIFTPITLFLIIRYSILSKHKLTPYLYAYN